MITYYYSCFVMSQPRLVQVRGLASTRRPCPRRSRLGTSSHPLQRRKTFRYTLFASIAWNYVLCASRDTALGLDTREEHVLCTTPRTSTAENTLNAVYICAHTVLSGYNVPLYSGRQAIPVKFPGRTSIIVQACAL